MDYVVGVSVIVQLVEQWGEIVGGDVGQGYYLGDYFIVFVWCGCVGDWYG